MFDEQFDEQVRRLRRTGLARDPVRLARPVGRAARRDLYADIYQALLASERGAWLTSHGFVIHATKKEVSVIQGDVKGTAHLG